MQSCADLVGFGREGTSWTFHAHCPTDSDVICLHSTRLAQTQDGVFLAQTDNNAKSELLWPGTLFATDGRMKLVIKAIFVTGNQRGKVSWPGMFDADVSIKAASISS